MKITLNGKEYETAAEVTVAKLLASLGIPRPGTAVAVNESIVPRDQHEARAIAENDRIEIVRAIGGG